MYLESTSGIDASELGEAFAVLLRTDAHPS